MWGSATGAPEGGNEQQQRQLDRTMLVQQYPPPPGGGGGGGDENIQQQHDYGYENGYENGHDEDGGALSSTVELFSSAASAVFASSGAAAKELASQGRKAASQLASAAAPPPTQPPKQLGKPENLNQHQYVTSSIVPENSMLDAVPVTEKVENAEIMVPSSGTTQPVHSQQGFTSNSPVAEPMVNLTSTPPLANSGMLKQTFPSTAKDYPMQATDSSANTPQSSNSVQHSTFQPIHTSGHPPVQPSLPSKSDCANGFLNQKDAIVETAPAALESSKETIALAVPKPSSAPSRDTELPKPSLRTPSLKVPAPRSSTPKPTRRWGGFKTPSSGGLPRSRSSTPTVSNQVHPITLDETIVPPTKPLRDTHPVEEKPIVAASAQSLNEDIHAKKEKLNELTRELDDGDVKSSDALSEKDGSATEVNDSLPEGWDAHIDQNTGILYYHNKLTNETSWEFPKHVVMAENLITKADHSNHMSTGSMVENDVVGMGTTIEIQETVDYLSNEKSLPDGWVEKRDPSSGNNYYFNTITNETTWKLPTERVDEAVKRITEIENKEAKNSEDVKEDISSSTSISHFQTEEPPVKNAAEPLLKEWVAQRDANSGRVYYFNSITNETTWEKPQNTPIYAPSELEVKADPEPTGTTVSESVDSTQQQQQYDSMGDNKETGPEVTNIQMHEPLSNHPPEIFDASATTEKEISPDSEIRGETKSRNLSIKNSLNNVGDVAADDINYGQSACSSEGPTTISQNALSESNGVEGEESALTRPDRLDAASVDIEPSTAQQFDREQNIDQTGGEKECVNQESNSTRSDSHEDASLNSGNCTVPAEGDEVVANPTDELHTPNELRDGWIEKIDENSGKTFYYHSESNETTWEKPLQRQKQAGIDDNSMNISAGNDFDSNNLPTPFSEDGSIDNQNEEWVEELDQSSGKPYYLNKRTNETTWERPIDLRMEPGDTGEIQDSMDVPGNDETTSVQLNKPNDETTYQSRITPNSFDSIENLGGDLPDGWQQQTDEMTGNMYYFNAQTNETSWEKPLATHEAHHSDFLCTKTNDVVSPSASHSSNGTREDSELPDGWVEVYDQTTEKSYYHNSVSGQTCWEKPFTSSDQFGDESDGIDNLLQTVRKAQNTEASSHIVFAEEMKSNIETSLNNTVGKESKIDIPPLPDGWTELTDESTAENYYVNEKTQETTWSRPLSTLELSPHSENTKQMEPSTTCESSSSQTSKNVGREDPNVDSPAKEQLQSTEEIPSNDSSPEVMAKEDIKSFEDEDLNYNSGDEHSLQETDDSVEIPVGWEKLIDPGTGKPYFFNREENLTQWDLPAVKDIPAAEESESTAQNHERRADETGISTEPVEVEDVNANPEDSNINNQDPSAKLSDGWMELVDENTGQVYYFNEEKKITTWELPKDDDRSLGCMENPEGMDVTGLEPDIGSCDSLNQPEIPVKNQKAEILSDGPETLPKGWSELVDPSGNTYYFNEVDKTTTWERPILESLDQAPTTAKSEETEFMPTIQEPIDVSKDSRSSNDITRRSRPNCSFVSFGFGGKLCIHRRSNKGKVEIHKVNSLLSSHPIVLAETKKRDHGIIGSLNGAENDSVSAYIRGQVNVDSSDDLWSLIQIAAESEGRLRSDEGVADTSSPESAMIRLFLQASVGSEEELSSAHSSEDITRDRDALERVESLLLHGKREEAVEAAVSGNHFGLALLVAGMCGGKTFQNATKKFADKALLSGSPLYTLALLFSGNFEPPPDSALEKIGLMPTVWSNSTTALLHSWKQHLCAIISNRILGWDRIVLSLGDRLLELGDIKAAHCCYMVCGCPLSSVLNSSSRLTVIGCDHLVPMDAALLTQEGLAAFERSEAYEWAKRKGNPDALIQTFQPFKLAYAMFLADLGYREEAEDYVKSIRKCSASLQSQLVDFKKEKPASVWNLSQKELFPIFLDEFENRLFYEKNPQPQRYGGDGSLDRVPSGLSMVSNNENVLNSMVPSTKATVETLPDSPHLQESPGEIDPIVEGSAHEEGQKSSNLNLQSAVGASESIRSSPLVSLHVAQNATLSSKPTPETAPTPVFQKPNHINQPITTSQASLVEPKDMNTFTSPGLEPAPNSVPTPLKASKNKFANPSTPSFPPKEEPNRKLREAPHSAPPDLQKLKEKGASESEPKRSWGLGGLRTRITKLLNPEATTADLGGSMEAYFDKEKKVWVFPGEDPNEVAKPIGPPPIVAKEKEEHEEVKEKEETSSLDPLSAMMAPPPRSVSSIRRPAPGLPSSNNMPGLLMPPGTATKTPMNGSNAPPTFMVFKPNPDTNKENNKEEN